MLHEIAGVPVFGGLGNVTSAVSQFGADTVAVLACPEMNGVRLRELAWDLEKTGTDMFVAPALIDVAGPRTTIRPVAGLPLLHVDHPELAGGKQALKSVFDKLLALTALMLLSPLFAVIALAIKLADHGPVFFRQVRIGKNGQSFTLWKFRTMVVDAEQRKAELAELNEGAGALFKMRRDPRVTRAGVWLRRYSLDELPQLFNVLIGEHVPGRAEAGPARGGREVRRSHAAQAGGQAGHHRPVAGQRPVGPVVGRGRPARPALRGELVASPWTCRSSGRPGLRSSEAPERTNRRPLAATGCPTQVPTGGPRMADGRIVTVLAADDRFSLPLAATARSIVSHLSPGRELDMYLCDMGITGQNREKIQTAAGHPAVRVHWVSSLEKEVEHLPETMRAQGITRAAYARLFIPWALPRETDRVLYLDCDLIVRRCIGELFDTPMGDFAAMGGGLCGLSLCLLALGCALLVAVRPPGRAMPHSTPACSS